MSLTSFLPAPPAPLRLAAGARKSASVPLVVSVMTRSPEALRKQVTAAAHTVVVKIGTRVLTQADGTLDVPRIEQLAEEVHGISSDGRRVVLVSSDPVPVGTEGTSEVLPTAKLLMKATLSKPRSKILKARLKSLKMRSKARRARVRGGRGRQEGL